MVAPIEEPKSKSQKKRDAEMLQKMGVDMIDLSLEKLDQIPLPDHLKRAIIEAKKLKSHGAIRRQAQLIGKLMRHSESADIIAAYEQLSAEHKMQSASFHQVEQWRTKLMQGGKEALTEFVDTYQPLDIQLLRQLVKKAIDEASKGQVTGASRTLFRHLRSCIPFTNEF